MECRIPSLVPLAVGSPTGRSGNLNDVHRHPDGELLVAMTMRVNFWAWYMCKYLLFGRSIILKFDSRNYLYQWWRLWMIVWSQCRLLHLYCAIFLYVQVMICACVEHTDTGGYTKVCVYVCLLTIVHYLWFVIFFSCFFRRLLFVLFFLLHSILFDIMLIKATIRALLS